MSKLPTVPVDDDVFDLSFCREEVKIRINGNVEKWYLREFGGVERDQYREYIRSMFDLDEKGQPTTPKSQAGAEQLLLSLTLHKPDDTRVSIDEINALIPGMLQVKLAEKAARLCGLGAEAKEDAKKN